MFTPDGERLLFVRGGAPNRRGEVPDPLYTPDEEGRAVWRVRLDSAAPRNVVDGGGFTLSPDGSRIAFSRGADLIALELSGEAEPEHLARVRGTVSCPGSTRSKELAAIYPAIDAVASRLEGRALRARSPLLSAESQDVATPE